MILYATPIPLNIRMRLNKFISAYNTDALPCKLSSRTQSYNYYN